jgi:hypothetical protein
MNEQELKELVRECNRVAQAYQPRSYCTIHATLGFFPYDDSGDVFWDTAYWLRVCERDSGDVLLRCDPASHLADLPARLRGVLAAAPLALRLPPPKPTPAPEPEPAPEPPPRRTWTGHAPNAERQPINPFSC